MEKKLQLSLNIGVFVVKLFFSKSYKSGRGGRKCHIIFWQVTRHHLKGAKLGMKPAISMHERFFVAHRAVYQGASLLLLMHLCAVAAPPESILRLRVEFVWSIFPNSWRILSPPSQRESTLQRSNCVSLHFMVKRIPGKNGQKRLIKLHLLHLTIEFRNFPYLQI